MKAIPTSNARSAQLVEDLVQDVLLSIHQKRHTFRTDARILPWVFAIAKYRWIDHARMMKVRPEFLAWTPEEASTMGENLHVPAPEENLHADELAPLMDSLSFQQRELIRLAKLEELPLAEIATRMELSLSSVKVGIHRAVMKMQKIADARFPRKGQL